jgi:hypothetical protein
MGYIALGSFHKPYLDCLVYHLDYDRDRLFTHLSRSSSRHGFDLTGPP